MGAVPLALAGNCLRWVYSETVAAGATRSIVPRLCRRGLLVFWQGDTVNKPLWSASTVRFQAHGLLRLDEAVGLEAIKDFLLHSTLEEL